MRATLVRANQLRRQMTAAIGHELCTSLSGVVGYLASLREGLLQPKPEQFKIMHEEAQHLQRLMEDRRLLSLADAAEHPLNCRVVGPDELVNLAAPAFGHQTEQRGIRLAVLVKPGLPPRFVDRDRILQVLDNLLTNGLRYTPECGEICLAAQLHEGRLELRVQDCGAGVGPERLPHIFERFYRAGQARPQGAGESGLEFAITTSLVEAHGGTISATSTLGGGTVVSIGLSVAPR